MSFTKLLAAVAAALSAGLELAAAAAPDGELGDLAARVDYGFYGGEPRVIEAARDSLERYAEDDAAARYYFAFSGFRLAQLDAQRGVEAGRWVEACIDSATPEDDGNAEGAAEAWILVAACASIGGQARRRDQALERARSVEPKNPRIALLDAWAVSPQPALAEPAVRDAAEQKLTAAVAAFEAWSAPPDAPEWGEAEALAQLGELALQRGEARAARDLGERALLLAPGYRLAVDLLGKLQGGRSR